MKTYIIVGVFIIFDIVTGLLSALKNSELNSTKLREGLYHKISEILAVVGGHLLEYGTKYINLGVNIPFFNTVCVYICITELVSIIENLGKINPLLAKFFKPYIQKLSDRKDELDG